ncbi:MAG TPA: hypothetical protein VFW40_10555 [Capsulimonadaceae bacterium]|nr:hypothetical protein [Capsulimonadaceae bacterium]
MTTLAELRQANLQEQKTQEDKQNGHAPEQTAQAPTQEEQPPTAAQSDAPAQEPRPVSARAYTAKAPGPATAPAAKRRSNPAMTVPAIKDSDKEALVEILPAISKAVVALAEQAAVNEGEPEKSAAFLNRVRGSLNHKILYPSGVKTTVDMSPSLFHRAKKYCLDHGNVTLRQLFLDLMTEFLAEEGY